jgi:hypothetical protein
LGRRCASYGARPRYRSRADTVTIAARFPILQEFMMSRRFEARRAAVAGLLLGLAACGSDDAPVVDNTCDPLVPEYCAFPFPNDFFSREDSSTPTGLRLDLKPGFFGPTDPSPFNVADGWSAGSTILFQLPEGTDTGFATPDNEGMEHSLSSASKTVIIDAETGERIAHFAEEDKNSFSRNTRALTIRPVDRLKDGHRYIVAVRDVVDESGAVIPAGEAFAALRDGNSSSDPAVSSRRAKYRALFEALEDAGVPRANLQLAWDFTTASSESNTAWLLHMRDEGLRLIRDEGHPYTITEVRSADCGSLSGDYECVELTGDWPDHVLHYVLGTFRAPNFMTEQVAGGRLILGEDGLPRVNPEAPWHDQPFYLIIPNSAADSPKPLLQYGHGLFGNATQITAAHFRSFMDEYGYAFFGTKLDGMAFDDESWIFTVIAGISDVSVMTPMFDRLHQGMMQQIVLMDTMIESFSEDEDFGRFLDPSVRHYHGISQGGIMGSVYAAISPHVERAALGVMGQPYSLLLFRSVDFTPFFVVLQGPINDPRGWQMAIDLMQMLWDRCEPSGYSHHLVPENKLPGARIENVLMRSALGDHQVTQLGAHVMARAMNAKALTTGVRPDGVFGLEYATSASATENFIAEYDFGNPIDPPCNLPPAYLNEAICDDPHGKLRTTEAARKQLAHYLETGEGRNFCPDGEEVDGGAGDCVFPTAVNPAPTWDANCGPSEDDALSLLVCGL